MAGLFSYCKTVKRSLEIFSLLLAVIAIGISLKAEVFVEVDWEDSSVVCVIDDEENSETESDLSCFAVHILEGEVAVATHTIGVCDFRDIVPKYVLFRCLRLDC